VALIPFTLEEHSQLSTEIGDTLRRFAALGDLVTEAYGVDSQPAFGVRRTMKDLQHLKKLMQAQAESDLPGMSLKGLYE
jgi:hypothetical protein